MGRLGRRGKTTDRRDASAIRRYERDAGGGILAAMNDAAAEADFACSVRPRCRRHAAGGCTRCALRAGPQRGRERAPAPQDNGEENA